MPVAKKTYWYLLIENCPCRVPISLIFLWPCLKSLRQPNCRLHQPPHRSNHCIFQAKWRFPKWGTPWYPQNIQSLDHFGMKEFMKAMNAAKSQWFDVFASTSFQVLGLPLEAVSDEASICVSWLELGVKARFSKMFSWLSSWSFWCRKIGGNIWSILSR